MGCGIKFVVSHLRAILHAAGKSENLPYTILGGLMLISLVARLVLILQ